MAVNSGDTDSCNSERTSVIETRRGNKIVVRRTKPAPAPSKMRTSASMPKVRCTFSQTLIIIQMFYSPWNGSKSTMKYTQITIKAQSKELKSNVGTCVLLPV